MKMITEWFCLWFLRKIQSIENLAACETDYMSVEFLPVLDEMQLRAKQGPSS